MLHDAQISLCSASNKTLLILSVYTNLLSTCRSEKILHVDYGSRQFIAFLYIKKAMNGQGRLRAGDDYLTPTRCSSPGHFARIYANFCENKSVSQLLGSPHFARTPVRRSRVALIFFRWFANEFLVLFRFFD